MMSFNTQIIYWFVFLIISLFFSGADIAFVASDKLRHAVSRKDKGPFNFMINTIYSHPRQFVSSLMVGKIISLVLFIYFTFIIAITLNSALIVPEWLLLLLIILFCTIFVLITNELLPRTIFKKNSNAWVRILTFPSFIFYLILYPIAGMFLFLSKGFLKLFGVSFVDTPYGNTFGRVDLDEYVRKSIDDISKESEVDSEVKIFRNALDFSSMKIKDCMVPRADIVAVDIETDAKTLNETFIETGISRILIYKDDIDDIVGYMHMWEMFNLSDDWTKNIASISFVPESMLANQLMSDLMQQRKSIAVVVDEFGGTSGIVTMEDLVEEIFGEIEDEYDIKSKFIKQESDNEYVLSGRVELDHLNEKYGFEIPESDSYSTIAGYLLHHTQRFPKTYETITIGKYTFKILKVTERKIEVVRIII